MIKNRIILLVTMLFALLAGEVFAAPSIVTPSNEQNLTADITYNVTSGTEAESYVNLTWWYSTGNGTFTNLTARYNSSSNSSQGQYIGTLGVADLTDGTYYLMVSGNNSLVNSTSKRVGFDDTVPTITTTAGNETRVRVGKTLTITISATDGTTNSSGFTDGVWYCEVNREGLAGYVNATDAGTNSFTYDIITSSGGNFWFRVRCTDYHSQTSAFTNYKTYSAGGGTSEDGYVIKPLPPQAVVPAPSKIKIGERAVDKRIIGLLALAAIAFWLFKKK